MGVSLQAHPVTPHVFACMVHDTIGPYCHIYKLRYLYYTYGVCMQATSLLDATSVGVPFK